jgi:HK97 family phage major capsid protein
MLELRQLRDRQARLVTEARSYLEQITAETPAERAADLERQHDAAMAEWDTLEARAQRLEQLEERERALEQGDDRRPRGGDQEERAGGVQRDPVAEARAAFTGFVQRGMSGLSTEQRQLVARLHAELSPEQRALAAGTAASGGYTIPQGFLPEITRSMAAWGPMLDPGVTRVVDTDTGAALPWPTSDDTGNVGALLAENAQITEQDVAFGAKQLDAYTYTSKIVRVSMLLLQDSAFDMGGLIDTLFGERIGRAANIDLTVGNGTAIAADEIIDLYHSVDPAYRNAPGFRMMFHDNTLKAIRKLKDGQGNYLLDSLKDGGAVLNLAGITVPYVVNQAMAATIATGNKTIVAGDFNKYIVRRVKDYTLLRMTERYADFLQVGFVAFNRIDGELSDAAAVKVLQQA